MSFTLACSDSSFTIPWRKGIGKCWFLKKVKKRENPKKTSLRESRNRQQFSNTRLAPLDIVL